MAEFTISPEARDDLDHIHAYISGDNPDAADDVLESAFSTFENLSRMPSMGREREFKSSQLSGLRSFTIQGFRNYLIFYRENQNGIEVVRVVHAARNLDSFSD